MEEVLRLLEVLCSTLEALEGVYQDLLPVLDEEESLVAGFSMADLQRVIVEKDLVVARALRVEEKRVGCLNKLAPLMGLHLRGKTLSGPEFLCAFGVYCANLREQRLVDGEILGRLEDLKSRLGTQISYLQHRFDHHFWPRIERNRILMAKLCRSVGLSLSWMESIARQPMGVGSLAGGYGPRGVRLPSRDVSLLKVKV